MSCHVMSCHVMSCHVMSRHLTSSHVLSYHVMSCHVMSCHVMSCHVMSCHVTSCHVMSCHVMSSHVFSRLVISCHLARESCSRIFLARESCSRIFLPSLLNSSIMAAGWPQQGFRNRGPVREPGSERRSRCGAACTASVRVWRRAHFWDLGIVLRGRLRGSGVLRACACGAVHIFGTWASFCVAGCGDRACCEHAGRCVAGVLGRCAVGIGFRACFVHAWPTCVSCGRLRESYVLGACWERAGGHAAALCRGDWVPGAFCTCMANMRFAWQAAGIVRAGRFAAGVPRVCRGRSAVGIAFGACRARA